MTAHPLILAIACAVLAGAATASPWPALAAGLLTYFLTKEPKQ